jgi:hypothetical protein
MALQRRTFFKLAGLGLLPGCGILGFDVTQPIPRQTVAGSPLGGLLPLDLFRLPLMLDIQQQTQAMGTGPASSAKLTSLALSILSPPPPQGSFDFLAEISISVVAEGLAAREVAFLRPVPMRQARIELGIVPDVDLLPYANKGATLTASAKGHLPETTIEFDGVVVVHISV